MNPLMQNIMQGKLLRRVAIFCMSVALVSFVVACGKEKVDSTGSNVGSVDSGFVDAKGEQQTKSEQSDNTNYGQTVAEVNSTPIYKSELDYALQRLHANAVSSVDNTLTAKVLDSLITSRAMALLAEQELSEQDKMLLNIKAKAYKEELLVKAYIDKHADAQPVTTTMVKTYYDQNPQEFGGDAIKSFEFISSYGALDNEQRQELVKALSNVSKDSSFKKLSESLSKKTFKVRYKKAEMRASIIQSPLKEIVEKTEVGQLAPLHNDSQIILLRVIKERFTPAKPLAEVSAQIRKRLSPLQFKKAIKNLAEQATKKVVVETNGS